MTFPPARFDLEILFSVLTPECVCAGKELMGLTVLNLNETPGEAPPTAVITVSYLPGMSWPGLLRPGAKSLRIVQSPPDRYAPPRLPEMSSSDSWLTDGRHGLIYTDALLSRVGQFWSHATLNKCVQQDWWRRAAFSWGGRKCCLPEIQGWWNGSGGHFPPSCCKGKKGWKELHCQEKVLISRYGWCYRKPVLCLCVTSVHSHQIHYIWYIQFNFIYKASLTIEIVSCLTQCAKWL